LVFSSLQFSALSESVLSAEYECLISSLYILPLFKGTLGNVSLAELEAYHSQNQLNIIWKPLQTEGQVKIWVNTTNAFKQGGKDTYPLVAKVPLEKGQATIDASKLSSDFYKNVIEGPANSQTK
jgi:hypothetical protein